MEPYLTAAFKSVFFACSSMSCPYPLIICSYHQKKIKQPESMDHEQIVIKLLCGFESFDKTIL